MNVLTGLMNNITGIDVASGVDDSSDISSTSDFAEEMTELGDIDSASDSFVMMMAHVLNQGNQPNTPHETTTAQYADDIIATDLASNNAVVNLNTDEATETLLDTDNIALSWINSEGFEPPATSMRKEDVALPSLHLDMDTTDHSDFMTKDESKFQENDSFNILDSGLEFNNKQDLSDVGSDKPFMGNDKALAESITKQDISVVNNDKILQSTQAMMGASPSSTAISLPLNDKPQMFNAASQPLDISVDIAHPEWTDKFSDHIVWLGQQEIKSALIKISPEELGPIEINLKLDKEIATLNISSHSAHVCEIVDQSLPKLKEMMAEQGISLMDVHIDSNRDAQQFYDRNESMPDEQVDVAEDETVFRTPLLRKRTQGLIDYFA